MFTLTLLSKGWTITSASPTLPKEWLVPIAFGFTGYFSLFVLERVAREIDHKCAGWAGRIFALSVSLVTCSSTADIATTVIWVRLRCCLEQHFVGISFGVCVALGW
jgi:hypothetical protein